jgi:uncharacterized membrane protein YhaH (DUF805 family)
MLHLAQQYQYDTSTGGGGFVVFMVVYLAVIAFMIAAMWKMFTKAGQPGWAAIVPIYNIYVLLKITGRPGWWLLLAFIPLVNLIIFIIVDMDLAKSFGKGSGFGIGLLLLPFIFYPILGFGSATYSGPAAAAPAAA